MEKFPETLKYLISMYNIKLVGSGATLFEAELPLNQIKDLDFICPPENWWKLGAYLYSNQDIRQDIIPTPFGGWSFRINEVNIDIWPDSIDTFLPKAASIDNLRNRETILIDFTLGKALKWTTI